MEPVLASERHGTTRAEKELESEDFPIDPNASPAAKAYRGEILKLIDEDPTLSPATRQLYRRKAQGMHEEWSKHIAPPTALGLPALLEKRRLEYGIVDNAFEQEALFDRIYVWQIPRSGGETFEGTSIIRPPTSRQSDEDSCPRGIVVSAGLKALDNLRSNGVDLGHIVNFVRLAPWRMPIGNVNGVEIPPLLVLRDGDLISSEDLATMRRKGLVKTLRVKDGAKLEHRLQGANGEVLATRLPWMAEDY